MYACASVGVVYIHVTVVCNRAIHMSTNVFCAPNAGEWCTIIIDGETCHFRGTVTVVCADNPASASLGGFNQSGSAFRFCLHCMGTEDDIQT